MSEVYESDKEYYADAIPISPFRIGVYEHCRFRECNLANQDMSRSQFINCRFEQCDLSMSNLFKTSFQKTHFDTCKLIGLRFDRGDSFMRSFTFEDCQLNLSSFLGCEIPETTFLNCNLAEVDFSEANLSKASFNDSDLNLAIFDHTNVSGADFRDARNYLIDPLQNNIKKAQFSVDGLPGLLTAFELIISRES